VQDDPVGERNVETKTCVFISYSRKDMAFADKLEAALRARGFEAKIDRQEIYAFEDWWTRIEALIGAADTVVFVISPEAVKVGRGDQGSLVRRLAEQALRTDCVSSRGRERRAGGAAAAQFHFLR
jgi:hypothetical protein